MMLTGCCETISVAPVASMGACCWGAWTEGIVLGWKTRLVCGGSVGGTGESAIVRDGVQKKGKMRTGDGRLCCGNLWDERPLSPTQ